jgi:DNA-binding response OmpR family regulator
MSMMFDASAFAPVMVVNSEPIFLQAVGLLLEEEGFRAVTMHIRETTLGVIRGLAPRLLILDFVHARSEAWDLLTLLDADSATAALPILATSTDEEVLERVQTHSLERPLLRVLVKPMNLDDLLVAVQGLCGQP